ncbi:MAG: hypothetical protein K2M61_00175 [Muribaculaceae bacterium]|nr:hypothetical protein [Muribaculaceae bacterium]
MITSPSDYCEFDKYDEPRLHIERLMRVKLVEFDLPLRLLLSLESAGVKTLGDLVNLSYCDLRKIPQLGKISADRIVAFLDSLDLSLKK